MNEILSLSPERRRLDSLVRAVYGHGITAPRTRGSKPKRRCDRCGIDTRRPTTCLDCTPAP